jgi:hypothetical protein
MQAIAIIGGEEDLGVEGLEFPSSRAQMLCLLEHLTRNRGFEVSCKVLFLAKKTSWGLFLDGRFIC